MNIGFVEGLKLYPFECFIFHDVDLIPEDDRNLYTCPDIPRHMSVAIDKYNYKWVKYIYSVSDITIAIQEIHEITSNEHWFTCPDITTFRILILLERE